MPRPSLDEIFSAPRPSLDDIFGQKAPDEQPSTWDKYGQPFVDTLKHGVSDLGDFATMNYSDKSPMADILKQKVQAGTADRHDYERAFLEGAGNSPGGKILGAASGLIPEANVVTTALNNWINPAVVNKTGIDPSELQLLEMAAPIAAKGASKALGVETPNQLPLTDAAITGVKATTYPIRHPIDAAGTVIEGSSRLIGAAAKPIIQPAIRGILEGDNPITGEPGLKTALSSETALEGARLGQKMGVNFSAGELTGNPTAMGIEDALANSGRWGGKFAEANQQKVDSIVGQFNKTLDTINKDSSSRTDVGDRISSAYNNTINSLVKARREQAKADAQTADIATKGNPVVDPQNFRQVLSKFIEEGNSPTATPAQRSAANQANQMLGELKSSPSKQSPILDQYGSPVQTATEVQPWKKLTALDVQNGLAMYGDGAKVGGGIWKDISTASDRRFAVAAKDALQKDLDTAADSGLVEAQGLKNFRDNYRNNSLKINDIKQTTVGKVIGSAEKDSQGNLVLSPEKIADQFSSMQPTELRNTLKFLDKNHPEVANIGRRYVLETALRKAQEGRGLRGEGTTKEFSKADFVKALPDKERLNALLKDPKAYNDIIDTASAMNRLIDYGSQKSGSQTAQRTDILAGIAKWGKGAFYRSLVSDSLAEDLLNPSKRHQIAAEIRDNSGKKK